MPNLQRPAENDSRSTSRATDPSIAVIGGSAAGLFTSLLLARRGLSVRVLERIETLLQKLPGLALAGNALTGIGVPDCVRSGTRAVQRVMASLNMTKQQKVADSAS